MTGVHGNAPYTIPIFFVGRVTPPAGRAGIPDVIPELEVKDVVK